MGNADHSHLCTTVNTKCTSGPDLIAVIDQAHQLMKRHLGLVFSPFGLSYPRYEILSILIATPGGVIHKSQIGKILGKHSTTITSLVDGLVASGLATRTVNSDDRRSTLVSITERGREVARSAARSLDDIVSDDPELIRRVEEDLRLACLRFSVRA